MPRKPTKKTSPPSLSAQLSKIILSYEKQDAPAAALMAAAEELQKRGAVPAFDEARKVLRLQEQATALAEELKKINGVVTAFDEARKALRLQGEVVAMIAQAQPVFEPVQRSSPATSADLSDDLRLFLEDDGLNDLKKQVRELTNQVKALTSKPEKKKRSNHYSDEIFEILKHRHERGEISASLKAEAIEIHSILTKRVRTRPAPRPNIPKSTSIQNTIRHTYSGYIRRPPH